MTPAVNIIYIHVTKLINIIVIKIYTQKKLYGISRTVMSFDFVIIISFFFRLDPLWTLGHISNIRNSSVSSLQFPSPVGYFLGHTGMCGLLWVGFYHCKIYQNSPEIVKKWSRIVKNAKKLLEMLNNIQQKSNRYG